MKYITIIFSFALLTSFSSNAQDLFPLGIDNYRAPSGWCELGCTDCCKFNEFMKGYELGIELSNWYSNAHACLERGYDEQTCSDAASYCFTMENIPWGSLGIFGSWVGALGLDQLFRIDCGNGTCFQCCYAGGNCHSSFVGFPVINCNINYGEDASAAGLTLVLDGDPGDPCLFAPQTCAHIPVCNSGLSPAEIDAVNNDPDHILKTPSALSNRRRWVANKIGEVWLNFLNTHGNTDPNSFDGSDENLSQYSPQDIVDFVTGRGGVDWKNNLQNSSLDWTQSVLSSFNNDSTAVAQTPSRLRAIYQAGVMRTITSVPNFVNRFNFVASKIWDEASIEEYIQDIEDPDAEILKHSHPIALSILKTLSAPPFNVLQDYRLLTVPLPDEADYSNYFNGTLLGTAPLIQITNQEIVNGNINLSIEITDFDDPNAQYPVTLLWGDGTFSKYQISSSQNELQVSHSYSQTGKYQMYITSENISGLKGIAANIVEVLNSSTNLNDAPKAISRVQLNDIEIKTRTFLGYSLDASFYIKGKDADGQKEVFGKMNNTNLSSGFFADTATLNHVFGVVPIGFDLRTLEIEFDLSYINGDNMWEALNTNNSWFKIDTISLALWNPTQETFQAFEFLLTPDMITLKDVDSYHNPAEGNEYSYDNPIYVEDELVIPFHYNNDQEIVIKGIEIEIPQTILDELSIAPNTDVNWIGDNEIFKETKPGLFENIDDILSTTNPTKNTIDFQVFPNPFSRQTTFSFTLDQPEDVLLEIFDSLGKKVKTLAQRKFNAGHHTLTFVPSAQINGGSYYARIILAETSTVKPIIIIN